MADDLLERAVEVFLVLVLVAALGPVLLNMIWEIEAVRRIVRELLTLAGLALAALILVYIFVIRSDGGF